MVVENILDFLPMEWLGDRVTNVIDNNLDALIVAGSGALWAFFKIN